MSLPKFSMSSFNSVNLSNNYSDIINTVNSPIAVGILAFVVILYSGWISSHVDPATASVLNNPMLRILFLFTVLMARYYNPIASVFLVVGAFLLVTLLYVFSSSTVQVKSEKTLTTDEIEQKKMFEQLRREIEEQEESSSKLSNLSDTKPKPNEKDLDTLLNKFKLNPDNKTGGTSDTVKNIINKLTGLIGQNTDGNEENSEETNEQTDSTTKLVFPAYRVEHPDSPVHMALNPSPPYPSYNTLFKNVDVDLRKLNPPFAVKNLPVSYNVCSFDDNFRPHLPTPHADNRPVLNPLRLNQEQLAIASKLNPPLSTTNTLLNGGSTEPDEPDPITGQGSNANSGGSALSMYSRNYHVVGGCGGNLPSVQKNTVYDNAYVLMNNLVSELKSSLSDGDVKNSCFELLRYILVNKNRTLKELFLSEQSYETFMKMLKLFVDKVKKCDSVHIVKESCCDLLSQIGYLLSNKLNETTQSVLVNKLSNQFGGQVPVKSKRDLALPDCVNQTLTVSANLNNNQFNGPQGHDCPAGYAGTSVGSIF